MNFITTIRRLISRLFVKESPMTEPVQPAVAGTVTLAQTAQTGQVYAAGVGVGPVQAQTIVADPSVVQLQARIAELEAEVRTLNGHLDQVEPAVSKLGDVLKAAGHDVSAVLDEAWALTKKVV